VTPRPRRTGVLSRVQRTETGVADTTAPTGTVTVTGPALIRVCASGRASAITSGPFGDGPGVDDEEEVDGGIGSDVGDGGGLGGCAGAQATKTTTVNAWTRLITARCKPARPRRRLMGKHTPISRTVGSVGQPSAAPAPGAMLVTTSYRLRS
jgi:hypothetical protein